MSVLNVIKDLKKQFPEAVIAYSDHTNVIMLQIELLVALGSKF